MASTRRNFIKQSALAAGALITHDVWGKTLFQDSIDIFKLPSLSYEYNALEPFIDESTMRLHHTKHHQAYVNNLNKYFKEKGEKTYNNVEILNMNINKKTPEIVRNNAGGHYNHMLFWELMAPKKNVDAPNEPEGKIAEAFQTSFGSFDLFKKRFEDVALKHFGSGWAWLYEENIQGKKRLRIGSTPNQDNPLMPIANIKGKPILALDVWEHAYYLKYQNKRADYISNWWNVVNWNKVNQLI
jgi:superoxide dismutase, Fe-Mn family